MGRLRSRPDTQHLPPNMCIRGSRYYLTLRDPETGKRRQLAAGATLDEAKTFARLHGILDDDMRQYAPPPSFFPLLLARAKTNARTKRVAITLTRADLEAMVAESGSRCAVSGIRFEYSRAPGERFRPWAPSVDRIDPRGPYVRENCRIVCAYVNLAMNHFGAEVFYAIARHVAATNRVNREPPRREFAEVSENT